MKPNNSRDKFERISVLKGTHIHGHSPDVEITNNDRAYNGQVHQLLFFYGLWSLHYGK